MQCRIWISFQANWYKKSQKHLLYLHFVLIFLLDDASTFCHQNLFIWALLDHFLTRMPAFYDRCVDVCSVYVCPVSVCSVYVSPVSVCVCVYVCSVYVCPVSLCVYVTSRVWYLCAYVCAVFVCSTRWLTNRYKTCHLIEIDYYEINLHTGLLFFQTGVFFRFLRKQYEFCEDASWLPRASRERLHFCTIYFFDQNCICKVEKFRILIVFWLLQAI